MALRKHTQLIKSAAADLQFDACGIADAAAIDPDSRLDTWLSAGYHATMEWMARSRDVRVDVQQKLPGTQSVIVLARNYYAERPTDELGDGRVSRYAWGRDYHRALRKPLRALADTIESLAPGAETYCSIDSGPVMEKAWAERAGIGWLGKNTLVLRRDLGSWFFLATILTTLKLEADAPVADQCGGCRLCLDACPTNAFVEPRVLDSNKCISYQTIENRGDVPDEIATNHGDWVFGCDICQEVCPWNRAPSETDETDFFPRVGHANPNVDRLQKMDDDSFLKEFAGTPIMRAKNRGMQRNAAIAEKNLAAPPHENER
jgi:epoxyqueuosine reductase